MIYNTFTVYEDEEELLFFLMIPKGKLHVYTALLHYTQANMHKQDLFTFTNAHYEVKLIRLL